MDWQARCIALTRENEELGERIICLEEQMGIDADFDPMFVHLTKNEAALLSVLMKRILVSREFAMTSIYGNRPGADEPEMKIIDVFICKLRKKLRPFGVEIKNEWGKGYRIDTPMKDKVNALIRACRAPEAVDVEIALRDAVRDLLDGYDEGWPVTMAYEAIRQRARDLLTATEPTQGKAAA